MDIVVSAAGTGGTATGIARAIKPKKTTSNSRKICLKFVVCCVRVAMNNTKE